MAADLEQPDIVVVKARQPLADVFTNVVAASLGKKGFDAKPVVVPHTAEEPQVIQQLAATGAGKLLLVQIDKWHSDTMTNVAMHYLLTAKVLDAQGNVLAANTITGAEEGMDNLKGSVMNPPGYAKKAVPQAFKDHIERLLNHDAVSGALS